MKRQKKQLEILTKEQEQKIQDSAEKVLLDQVEKERREEEKEQEEENRMYNWFEK